MQLQMSESPHYLLSKTESLDQSDSFPESSIEIALSSVSVDPNPNPKQEKEEEEKTPKFKLKKKLPYSIFHQHTALMALLYHTFFCL